MNPSNGMTVPVNRRDRRGSILHATALQVKRHLPGRDSPRVRRKAPADPAQSVRPRPPSRPARGGPAPLVKLALYRHGNGVRADDLLTAAEPEAAHEDLGRHDLV